MAALGKRSARSDREDGAPGVIYADGCYTLEEIERRLKLGEWGLRKAQGAGLRTIKVGRRKYIKGSDFLEFLDLQSRANSEKDRTGLGAAAAAAG